MSEKKKKVAEEIDNKVSKEIEQNLRDVVVDEIKRLEKIPWFTTHPDLLTAKKRIVIACLKGLDSIVKYGMYFLRKISEHFGVFTDYEVGRLLDKDGLPVVYIKLRGVHFLSEFNAELIEEPEFLREEKEKETDIFDETHMEMVKQEIEKKVKEKLKEREGKQ